MLFEVIIRKALTPPPIRDVQVKAHIRKKPANPKREALHAALAGGR